MGRLVGTFPCIQAGGIVSCRNGVWNWIETAWGEATGRLVHQAITALGGPLSAEAAHNLFVALAMDTGWFRHPNTRPETFTLAAALTAAGADPTAAYAALFEQNSPARMKLTGLVLERLQLTHGGRPHYHKEWVPAADFADYLSKPVRTTQKFGDAGRTAPSIADQHIPR